MGVGFGPFRPPWLFSRPLPYYLEADIGTNKNWKEQKLEPLDPHADRINLETHRIGNKSMCKSDAHHKLTGPIEVRLDIHAGTYRWVKISKHMHLQHLAAHKGYPS